MLSGSASHLSITARSFAGLFLRVRPRRRVECCEGSFAHRPARTDRRQLSSIDESRELNGQMIHPRAPVAHLTVRIDNKHGRLDRVDSCECIRIVQGRDCSRRQGIGIGLMNDSVTSSNYRSECNFGRTRGRPESTSPDLRYPDERESIGNVIWSLESLSTESRCSVRPGSQLP